MSPFAQNRIHIQTTPVFVNYTLYSIISQYTFKRIEFAIQIPQKAESSKRKIFLSQQARQEFLRYRTWSKEVLFRCGRIQFLSDLVIIREDGQTDNPNNFTRRWNKFLAANGIRRLKLHGLRHTCATMLLKNNVDIKSIATRLGHSHGTMVLIVYGHSLDSMSQAAAETMDKVLNISQKNGGLKRVLRQLTIDLNLLNNCKHQLKINSILPSTNNTFLQFYNR